MNEQQPTELEHPPGSHSVLFEVPEAVDSKQESAIGQTIAALQREVADNRRRMRWLVGFAVGLPVSLVLLSIVALIASNFGVDIVEDWFFGLFALTGPAVWLYIRATRKQRSLAREVAQCDSPEAVGPLIDSLLVPDERVRLRVVEAIARILPRLDANLARGLTVEQIKILNSQLSRAARDPLYYSNGMDGAVSESDSATSSRDGELPAWRRHTHSQNRAHALLVAVIHAAPSFGNRDTLRWLEILGGRRVRSRRRSEVTQAAAAASESLRSRLEYYAATDSLLRPAAPEESSELLRPASASSGNETAVLLRPHESDV